MGFRFHKRLRIFPGLWINLSKRGGSLSVGGRGATINVSLGRPPGNSGVAWLRSEATKVQ